MHFVKVSMAALALLVSSVAAVPLPGDASAVDTPVPIGPDEVASMH